MKEVNNLLRNNLITTSIKKIEYNNTNYTTPDDIGNALNFHFTELDRNKLPSCHPPQGSYQTPLFSTPSLLQEANSFRHHGSQNSVGKTETIWCMRSKPKLELLHTLQKEHKKTFIDGVLSYSCTIKTEYHRVLF